MNLKECQDEKLLEYLIEDSVMEIGLLTDAEVKQHMKMRKEVLERMRRD